MKWRFIFLVKSFVLKSTFDIDMIVSFWLVLACYTHFHHFIFHLCLYVIKFISCGQHIVGSCIFIHDVNLFLLMWLLTCLGLKLPSFCLFSFYPICILFSLSNLIMMCLHVVFSCFFIPAFLLLSFLNREFIGISSSFLLLKYGGNGHYFFK